MSRIPRTSFASALCLLFLVLALVGSPSSAATWYVATTGNDGNSCSVIGSPCLSVNGAYQKANSGDTIQVAAGTYGDQDMMPSVGKSSVVTVQPAPGADVNLGMLTIKGATYLEFRDMDATEFIVEMDSNHITIRNVNVSWLGYTGGSNITMIGGSVGPVLNGHPQIAPVSGWNGQGVNFVFDGVYFHDVTRNDDMYHVECLQVAGTTNMIIRNSKFQRCDVFDLSFTEYNGSGKVTNLLLENNFFDTAGDGGYMSVHFTGMDGGTIRFNSAKQAMVVEKDTSPNTGTMTILGNNIVGGVLDGTSGACIADAMTATYRYNITQGWQCDPTDANASPGFVDSSILDLHLQSGSTAINFVPTVAGGPSTDIDGVTRPQGSARDAGASEYAIAPATPATYYVRADGGNGTQCTGLADAAYPGSGSAQPCAVNKPSIAVARSAATGGDNILVRCADVFRDSIVVANPGASGNRNAINNYGSCTGTSTTTNNFPVVDGSILLNNAGSWTNTSGNLWQTTVATCPVKEFDGGSKGGNLWFNGVLGSYKLTSGEISAARDWTCAAGVLTVYSTGNPATAYTSPGIEAPAVVTVLVSNTAHIAISGLKVRKSLDYGIKLDGTTEDVVVSDVTVEDSASSGIGCFNRASGCVIRRPWVKNNGVAEAGTPHSHGIYIGGTNGAALIEDALIEGNRGWAVHPYMSSGVTVTRSILRNNLYGGALCADSNSDAITTYQGNLIYGNPYNFVTVDVGATSPTTCRLYNNVLYNSSLIGMYFTGTAASGVTYDVKNNIVMELGTQALQVDSADDATALNSDYNNFYRASGTAIRWQGTNYPVSQLSFYQSASGKDANSIATDPKFVNAASGRFQLESDSPALKKGVDLGTGFGLHPLTTFPYSPFDFDRRAVWPMGPFGITSRVR